MPVLLQLLKVILFSKKGSMLSASLKDTKYLN